MNNDQRPLDLPANQLALARFAWIFAAGLAISASFPPILFAPTASVILGFSAGILATVALFGREPLWGDHLTRWDVAAALYALSLFTSFFVDRAGVYTYIETQRALSG